MSTSLVQFATAGHMGLRMVYLAEAWKIQCLAV